MEENWGRVKLFPLGTVKDSTMRKLASLPKYTQECIREVKEMQKHPLTQEEFSRQIEENRRRSELRSGRK